MSASDVTYAVIWEDGGATFLARVVGVDGSNMTQSAVSTITCAVFDLGSATPETAVSTPTVTKASTVFDTLQTDGRWTKDTTGYNFRHTIGATVFSGGGKRYGIEYKFTPTSGEVYWVCYEVVTSNVRTS
jgi:hypothetical protein